MKIEGVTSKNIVRELNSFLSSIAQDGEDGKD